MSGMLHNVHFLSIYGNLGLSLHKHWSTLYECGSYCYNVAQLAYHFDYIIKIMFSFNHIISIPTSILISIPITFYIIQS